jgi:hypothetical protein
LGRGECNSGGGAAADEATIADAVAAGAAGGLGGTGESGGAGLIDG